MLSRLNIYRIKNETEKRKEEEEEKMQKTRLIIFVVAGIQLSLRLFLGRFLLSCRVNFHCESGGDGLSGKLHGNTRRRGNARQKSRSPSCTHSSWELSCRPACPSRLIIPATRSRITSYFIVK